MEPNFDYTDLERQKILKEDAEKKKKKKRKKKKARRDKCLKIQKEP